VRHGTLSRSEGALRRTRLRALEERLMKANMRKVSMLALAAGVTAVAGFATVTLAIGPIGGGCGKGTYCLDVWKPVLCPNGVVYSNDCYAAKACQKYCLPYGL